MRTQMIRLSVLALATFSLAACTDQKDPIAPAPTNAYLVPIPKQPIIQITSPNDLVEIVAGDRHTCIRKRSGVVACWGSNLDGQVGATTTTQCGTFGGDGACSRVPVTVTSASGLTSATRLTGGAMHNCALDANGAAWCWGLNFSGEIGKGAGGKAYTPAQVVGGLTFSVLSAGRDVTCGSAKAGGIYCWGVFPSAPGPAGGTWSPFEVATNAFTALAVTRDHVCGDIGSHNWLCWGSNKYGQLGSDPLTMPSTAPYTWVHAVDGASNVAVAGATTCADQSSSVVQCFGSNSVFSSSLANFGLLGNPLFVGGSTFAPQTAGQLHGVVLGDNHACALDSRGAAFCWGIGDDGQLGAGSFQSSSTPTPILGGLFFRALAVGLNHTCGIASDNHVYCWGDNYYGQLGQPAASMYGNSSPVQAVDP